MSSEHLPFVLETCPQCQSGSVVNELDDFEIQLVTALTTAPLGALDSWLQLSSAAPTVFALRYGVMVVVAYEDGGVCVTLHNHRRLYAQAADFRAAMANLYHLLSHGRHAAFTRALQCLDALAAGRAEILDIDAAVYGYIDRIAEYLDLNVCERRGGQIVISRENLQLFVDGDVSRGVYELELRVDHHVVDLPLTRLCYGVRPAAAAAPRYLALISKLAATSKAAAACKWIRPALGEGMQV